MRALILLACIAALGCEESSSQRPASYPPPGYPPSDPGGPPPSGPPPSGPPLRSDEISSVINSSYPTFTDCYMKSESFMQSRSGAVTIFFDVAPPGTVASASDRPPPGAAAPALAALQDPKLTECLVARFFALRFRTSSENTPASWTFQFSP